jgi:hypothetical protein
MPNEAGWDYLATAQPPNQKMMEKISESNVGNLERMSPVLVPNGRLILHSTTGGLGLKRLTLR